MAAWTKILCGGWYANKRRIIMLRRIALVFISITFAIPSAFADQMDRSVRLPLLQAAKDAQKDSAAYASARQNTEKAMRCLSLEVAKEPVGTREKKRAQCYVALVRGLTAMETALTGLRADLGAIQEHLKAMKEKDWTGPTQARLQTLRVNLGNIRFRNDLLAGVKGVIRLDPEALSASQSDAVTSLLDQEQSLAALLPDLENKASQIEDARLAIADHLDLVGTMIQAMEIKSVEVDLAKTLTKAVMESRKIQLVLCLAQQDERCEGTNRTRQLRGFIDDNLLSRVTESVGLSQPNSSRVVKVELKNRLAERRK
jgi:hypothetical protein